MINKASKNFKTYVVATLISIMLIIGAGFLCGCGSIGASPADIQKSAVAGYLAQVNALSKEFNNALSSFQDDIKEKNVSNMQEKLKSAQGVLDEINKLEVPSGCEDVQKAYCDGYLQLQQALSEYIQIYSDFVNGQMDNSVLNQRVASVQKSYDEGMNLLRNADQLSVNK